MGNVNNDPNEDINLQDAIIAMRIMAGFAPGGNICMDSDVNNDNTIGTEEMLFILQKVSELR